MAFFYSRRKLRPRLESESGELNIVPYLDILMNLIMFMLLSITGLSAFGILNVSAPSYGPAAGVAEDAEKPKLVLSVLIAKRGFYVTGNTGSLTAPSTDGAPTLPRRADGNYDFAALTGRMLEVKKEFPAESRVIIGAEADVPYETLVQTMDAVRETPGKERQPLFADVTLGAL